MRVSVAHSVRSLAVGVALVSGAAAAQAQTVISRQIADEPVETIVTQGPNGTVVTRRPLGGAPVYGAPAPVYTAPAPVYAAPVPPAPIPAPVYGAPAPVYAPGTVGAAVVAPDDDVVVRAPAPRSRTVTRTTRRTVVTRHGNPPVLARTDVRRTTTVKRAVRPVTFTPAQRRIIYRTITRQQVIAPAPVARPYWSPPVLAQDDDLDTYIVANRAPAVAYTVGARLPATVPTYGVPQTVVAAVPAAQPYSYAVIGGRVYLVDPGTGVIVADVTY